jgi:hypothetical protein
MNGIPIGHVERRAVGSSISLSNLIGDFVGPRFDDIVDHDVGAGIGKGESDSTSDSLAGPSDEGTGTF